MPKPDNPDGSGDFVMISIDKNGKKTDILQTAEQQTKWNKRAAGATALAAACQAFSQVLELH